jgi:hypothetical protein
LLVSLSGRADSALLRTPAAFSVGNEEIVGLHGMQLDSDSYADLVVVARDVIVLAGATGDGNFVERRRIPTDGFVIMSALGDPQRDGRRLLAVVSQEAWLVHVATFSVARNVFASTGIVDFVGSAQDVTIADANGDGWSDVIGGGSAPDTHHRGSWVVIVSPGRTLLPPDWFHDDFEDVFVRDLDGDGVIEVLHRGSHASRVYALQGGKLVERGTIAASGEDILTADVDGNGRTDVIFDHQFTFTVVRQNVDGTWGQPVDYRASPGDGAPRLAVQDIDGDGIMDIVAAEISRLSVRRGRRDAALGAATTSLGSERVRHMAFGDFDGDGTLDAAWSDWDRGRFFAARGHGDGSFATYPHYPFQAGGVGSTESQPMRLFLTDLTGDTYPDVVASGGLAGHIEGLRNDGHGGFSEGATIAGEEGSTLLGVVDVDRDGKGDLVTARGNEVAVHPGRGDMTFAAPYRFSMPAGLAAVADVDGDGTPDLLDAQVNVRLNDGKGGFGDAVANPVELGLCRDFLLGDVSGDGALDILCVQMRDFVWTVRLQEHGGKFKAPVSVAGEHITRPAIGDLNGDGRVDLVEVRGGQAIAFLSRGDGSFTRRSTPAPGLGFDNSVNDSDMIVADFDGDLRADLAAGTKILLGDGKGGFGGGAAFDYGPQQVLAAGDVDGNGSLDLVGIDNGTGVNVLATRTAPAGKRAMPMEIRTSRNPSRYGEEVTIISSLPATGSLANPMCRVAFFADDVILGSAPFIAGQAALSVPFGIGTVALRTECRADAHFRDGSADRVQEVVKGDSVVWLEVPPPSSVRVNETYSFLLRVYANYLNKLSRPTGEYWLEDGAIVSPRQTLLQGTYSHLPFSASIARLAALRIHYSGDEHFQPSVSNTIVMNVGAREMPSMTIAGGVGGLGDLNATVTLRGDGAKPVTGSVVFREGTTVLGTSPIADDGTATLRVVLGGGSHEITAEYSGDGNYVPASVRLTVNAGPMPPRRRTSRS